MAVSPRTLRITAALLISAGLIAAGYFFAPSALTKIADAASTQELLKEYAAKDTDGDSLPDWQEALYGTNPDKAQSVKAGISDSEAVAQGLVKPRFSTDTSAADTSIANAPGTDPASGSLTERFARSFFEQYVRGKNSAGTPSGEELSAYVTSAVDALKKEEESKPAFRASQVILAVGSGPSALQAYGRGTDAVTVKPARITTKDEVSYFNSYIANKDEDALKHVAEIAKAYRATAKGLMTVPAPKELLSSHLALANALDRVGVATENMAAIKTDPLRALLGLGEYDSAAKAMLSALYDMETVYRSAHVRLGKPYDIYTDANAPERAITLPTP